MRERGNFETNVSKTDWCNIAGVVCDIQEM